MKRNLLWWITIYSLLHLVFFSTIFSYSRIAGGDYITYRPEHIAGYTNNSFSVWDSRLNIGFNTLGILHYAPYNYLGSFVGRLVSYDMVLWERLMWWIPFFVLAFLSSIYLIKTIFPQNQFWILAPFIFVFNSYVLLMLSGGQVAGIGLAFAISPLILALYIKNISGALFPGVKESLIRKIVAAQLMGTIVSVQIMFDLRIAYITLTGVFVYLISIFLHSLLQKKWKEMLEVGIYSIVIPGSIVLLLHAFWLIPLLIAKQSPIEQFGSGFTSLSAVKFFSFAQLEHTISFLHPNWPENIFGKVDFMKWEFILIPLFALSSLLFDDKNNTSNYKRFISFFTLLALLGVFLAKGANEPFGKIYIWLFEHFPGFIMFRDSTKWYTLIAVSYSLLIPATLWGIHQNFRSYAKATKLISLVFQRAFVLPVLFVLYIVWLLHPVWALPIGGTFKERTIPTDYQNLQVFLSSQQTFSRLLWIPDVQRFGLPSDMHPTLSGYEFFKASSIEEILRDIQKLDTEKSVQDAAIQYVIIPFDSEKDIFITDRMYDAKKYSLVVTALRKIPWLSEVPSIGSIKIFAVKNPKQHFWFADGATMTDYQTISTTHHLLATSMVKDNVPLIFSEKYDPGWVATVDGKEFVSTSYHNKYNSFVLPKGENKTIDIRYKPQQLVDKLLVVSVTTFAFCIIVPLLFFIHTQIFISRTKRDKII